MHSCAVRKEKHPRSPAGSRSIFALWSAFNLWLKIFRGIPKYASARGISAGDPFHNVWVRAGDGLDGGDPVRSGESKGQCGMKNGVYFELSESFARKSPFAEKIFREWFMFPMVKCGETSGFCVHCDLRIVNHLPCRQHVRIIKRVRGI